MTPAEHREERWPNEITVTHATAHYWANHETPGVEMRVYVPADDKRVLVEAIRDVRAVLESQTAGSLTEMDRRWLAQRLARVDSVQEGQPPSAEETEEHKSVFARDKLPPNPPPSDRAGLTADESPFVQPKITGGYPLDSEEQEVVDRVAEETEGEERS